jgi:hypothetical protein
LPEYGLRLEGVATVQRVAPGGAEAAEEIEVAHGNRLRILLTPETEIAGPLVARAVLDEEEGPLPLPGVDFEIASTGAVRLEGIVGMDVPFTDGRTTLLVAVGREGELPGTDVLTRRLSTANEASGEGWRAWRLHLWLVEG